MPDNGATILDPVANIDWAYTQSSVGVFLRSFETRPINGLPSNRPAFSKTL